MAGATRAETHEALEGGEVLEVDDLPHVGLRIGRHVRGHAVARGDVMGVDSGIAVGKDQRVEPGKGLGTGGKLADREGQEIREADTAGERLGDAGQESELLGACQHEAPRDPLRVDHPLQPGEEVGPALGLVEDGALGEPRQEPLRIFQREGAFGGVLETDIGPVGEERPRQGRLPGLAWARDRDDRKGGRQAAQRPFELTGNHARGR